MAITKILNIQESEGRNPTTHLKNAFSDDLKEKVKFMVKKW